MQNSSRGSGKETFGLRRAYREELKHLSQIPHAAAIRDGQSIGQACRPGGSPLAFAQALWLVNQQPLKRLFTYEKTFTSRTKNVPSALKRYVPYEQAQGHAW